MLVTVQFSLFLLLVAGVSGTGYLVMRRARWDRHAFGRVFLLSLLAGSTGIWLSQRSMLQVRDHLRNQLIGFAPTYADEFARLGAAQVEFDTAPDDPHYLELIETQKRWLTHNPAVADIYTFRVVDGLCKLLVDSETDYDGDGRYEGEREMRTPIGEVFGDADENEYAAMAGEHVFVEEIYTDRWGTWISAYAPIFAEDGSVHSLLGVDFPAARWSQEIAEAQRGELLLVLLMHMALTGCVSGLTMRGRALERARVINAQFAAARMEAEAANQAKSDFLANMSHEIRTPMNSILGFTEVMLERARDPLDRSELEVIRRNADHLLALINDILDLSRIESGRMPVELIRFDMRGLVAEVDELLRPRAEERGIDLNIEWPTTAPSWVVSDADRIRQVLINLVGNAIKFTHEGSVTLRGDCEETPACGADEGPGTQRMIVLSVIDTGIGMTDEQLARAWRPFEQADNSITRRYGGTGLGLHICRRLAEGLGGTVHAHSAPELGSTFALRVPDRTNAAAGAQRTPERARCAEPENAGTDVPGSESIDLAAIDGMHVLYVEDGADNRRLVVHHLTAAGAVVQTAADGLEGVERYLAQPDAFDPILMDMQMPVMDGYAATARLRAEGCNDFLSKPLSRSQLLKCCGRAAALRRRERAAA